MSKQIIDEGIVPGDQAALVRYLTYYGGLTIFQAVMVFGFIYLVSLLGERIRYDLRQRMFNHLQDLSLSYYSRTPVGWIMSRVTSDSDRVSDLVTWGLLDSTWAVMSILTSMVFMLYINWRMALIVFAMLPILFYVAIAVPQAHPGRVPQRAQDQLENHRRVQREYHRRAGGQSPGPPGRKPARVWRADRRDVPRRLPRRLAERAVPAHRADHHRRGAGQHRLVWRLAGAVWRHDHRQHPGLCVVM